MSGPKLRPIRFAIPLHPLGESDYIVVDAYPTATPGLVVHRMLPPKPQKEITSNRWQISNWHGYRIGADYRSRAAALEAAAEKGVWDWTVAIYPGMRPGDIPLRKEGAA